MSLKLALVAQALVAAAAPFQNLKVPLPDRKVTRQANGEVDGPFVLAELNRTLKKYHAPVVLPDIPGVSNLLSGILKRQMNEALSDQVNGGTEDEEYYGPGIIGARSPQTFTFDFDTGSSDLFVPGPQCGAAAGCKAGTQYSQTGTDLHNTTSVTYGSGQVTGENYLDSVTVAGLTAARQNVISLTSAAGFNTSDSNSLLGMGFSTIANSKKPTFFENLISQRKVSTQEFAFYLGRAASNTQSRSELTLGGRDSSRYTGAVTQVPVSTRGYWQVAVDEVDVSGVRSLMTQGQAAIDTGTTLVLAPTVAAAAIFAQIPGSFPLPLVSGGEVTYFAYPCNTKRVVQFVFAGKRFAINALDLNFGSLTSAFGDLLGLSWLLAPVLNRFCLAGIAGADVDPTQNLYVVGDVFLKNWYSIYSYNNAKGGPSVSFAKAN